MKKAITIICSMLLALPAFAQCWRMVSSGNGHSLAIKTDGSLWAWGDNTDGSLGDGTVADKYVPTHIGTDTDWRFVAAGWYHSMGIKTDGTLWAWGRNGYGELGV